MKREQPAVLAFFLLCATLALLPFLLRFGFSDSYDWALHLRWSESFYQALRQGVLYPRWVADANGGWGAPIFVFYPPLTYYSIAALRTLGLSDVSAIKALFWLAQCGLAASMYWAVRRLSSPRWALVACALAALAPQTLLSAYRWNMPASSLALVGAPVLIGVFLRPCAQTVHTVVICALAVTFIVLTHVPTTVQAAALLLVLLVFQLFGPGLHQPQARAPWWGCLLGLGLSACYWLPMAFSLPEVHPEALTEGALDWRFNFLYDFGARVRPRFQGDYSFLMWINVLPLLWVVVAGGTQVATAQDRWIVRALLAACALCFFMMTPWSAMAYQYLPALPYLQFPWRWQTLWLVISAMCLAAAMHQRSVPVPHAARACMVLAAALLLVGTLCVVGNRSWLGLPASAWTAPTDIAWARAAPMRDTLEHRPRSMGGDWFRSLSADGSATAIAVSGKAQLQPTIQAHHQRSWRARSDTGATVRLKTLCFPGWKVDFNGKPLVLGCDARGTSSVELPPGEGILRLRYRPTASMRWGLGVSMLSLVLLLGLCRRPRVKPLAARAA